MKRNNKSVILKIAFTVMMLTPFFVYAKPTAITEILAIKQTNADDKYNLPASRASYVFLKVPTNYVGSCVPNRLGDIRTVLYLYSRQNKGSLGRQEVKVLSSGKLTSLDGRALISDLVKEPYNVELLQVYNCNVPVLTQEQVQAVEKITGIVRFNNLPEYYFNQITDGPFKLNESDLYLSNRYRPFIQGNFQFDVGPYSPGFAISSIAENPGQYGTHAVYHSINGTCSTGTLANVDEATTNLLNHCNESDVYFEANKASKGVGKTVIMAIPSLSR